MTAKQGIGRNVLYPVFTLGGHMQLSRYEQEVVINFNVAEQMASVYCADPKYIRLMDRLVAEYPEIYKVTAVTEVSKTYSMPTLK